MSEEWRDIEGFPDYQVSDQGRVRSRKSGEWRMLSLCLHSFGYFMVSLYIEGEQNTLLVHRLVLEAFVGACPLGCETRHLNGNPADDRLCNLAWGTPKENVADKVRHGTMLWGERQSGAKLTDADVLEIRRIYQAGMGPALAKRYNVSVNTIIRVVTGHRFGHLPGACKVNYRGENHRNAKLTEASVREIRTLAEQGYTQAKIAAYFGISRSHTGNIIRRENWKHVE
ncbi:MAG: hypothetical protein DRI81_16345 [Chloroflexi bacterium]|nr:MAG: hypothetical protein DRI81_16345 [Chloroflexota bacterium]